ncbi:hypothetical protein [Bradyrhizobium sp. JR3.5]
MDNIETIRSVSPRYADLLEKNRELAAQLDELLRRGQELTQARHKQGVATWIGEAPRPKPQPVKRHEGAEALLGDLLPPQPEHEINPPPLPEAWAGAADWRALDAQIEAIAEAKKLLLPEIESARREYSRMAAERYAKDYAKVVAAVVKSAKALGDALLEHHQFIDQLRLAGVERRSLKPINLQAFGDLEGGTPLYEIIQHAIELGHADEKQRPNWKLPAPLPVLSIL